MQPMRNDSINFFLPLQELFGRIRVMHETPLVCEFLNIKLKNASLHNNSNKPLPDNSSHNAEQPKTGGLSFGEN